MLFIDLELRFPGRQLSDLLPANSLPAHFLGGKPGSSWNLWVVSKGGFSHMLQEAAQRSDRHLTEFVIHDGEWYAAGFLVTSSFDGEWHHLAGTYDGDQLKLHVDGQSDTINHVRDIDSSIVNVNIGHNADWPDHLYLGTINDVRIYNRAVRGIW